MKIISKLSYIIVLSGLAFGAFANDTSDSPFACHAQFAKAQGVRVVQPYQCPAHQETWVQWVKPGDAQNAALCTSGSPKYVPTSVCEVNPQYWREYTSIRHVCDPAATPDQCKVELY